RKSCPKEEPTPLARETWEYSVAMSYFSLSELRSGIEQLGDMKFTLLVDLCNGGPAVAQVKHIPAIRSLISDQCTSLIVSTTFLEHDPYRLLAQIQTAHSLKIVGNLSIQTSYSTSYLFANLSSEMYPLRRLILRAMLPPRILHDSHIFQRLHHLYLYIFHEWWANGLSRLGGLLKEVRTLGIGGIATPSLQPIISISSQRLVHLVLSSVSPSIFFNSTYRSLVALLFDGKGFSDLTDQIRSLPRIPFPSLRYLLYKGRLSSLSKFEAPNLLILAIQSQGSAPNDHRDKVELSKHLSINPRYVIMDMELGSDSLVETFLASARNVADLEINFDEGSLRSSKMPHLLSEILESNPFCPALLNLRISVRSKGARWTTNKANLISISRGILLSRKEANHLTSLESLKYKVTKSWEFDSCHGRRRMDELWERNLRDGSQATWDRERERLLSRPGWIDLQE
ncbi:15615_t:CDS:1, partial [Acaulospora colombiana]